MIITAGQWDAARAALRETGDRFADLVVPAPDARATADWSVADTAAHVATIASLYTHLVRPDQVAHPYPAIADTWRTTTVDTVADLNIEMMGHFTARDPATLAHRLREDIDRILAVTAGLDPAQPVAWLGDSRVPLAGVVAHLVNELMIHGRDIARATGAGWPMPPRHAAMFFELFLLGVVRYGYGCLLPHDETDPRRRIAVTFRSRYTAPVVLVLHHRRVSAVEPGGDTDVDLFFDPVTLNLMLFGRVSKLRAVLTGKVAVRGGRRPWSVLAFLRTVRLPS